jgi:glycine oxidase
MRALLEAPWRILPSIEELPVHDMWVGHRPGSRDDAPIIGPGPVEGLIYATGHHRNGVLLAPLTSDVIADYIISGVLDPMAQPFGLSRFTRARAA